MSIPTDQQPGLRGNLPGTEGLGIIFLETVDIERKVAGVWTSVAADVPATFEPLNLPVREGLATWTHKPLFCIWLLPDTAIADADRVVRSDGSRWYVRGAPLAAPMRTHLAALAERGTEDGLFAPIDPLEPS